MVYAQLYHLSTGWNNDNKDFSGPKVNIPMIGSDARIVLDARKSIFNQMFWVRQIIEKSYFARGITAFQIIRANNFLEKGHNLTEIISL